jgi:hypothetical protein
MSSRPECIAEDHEKFGGCYRCCDDCNFNIHRCHFCGSDLTHNSYSSEKNAETGKWELQRHWLSDCRPDLVEHTPGPLCTWPHLSENREAHSCYAYNDHGTWTDKHEHFYTDGPMT